jgi:hypothetical protein
VPDLPHGALCGGRAGSGGDGGGRLTGIDGISLNPDALVRGVEAVLEAEREVGAASRPTAPAGAITGGASR